MSGRSGPYNPTGYQKEFLRGRRKWNKWYPKYWTLSEARNYGSMEYMKFQKQYRKGKISEDEFIRKSRALLVHYGFTADPEHYIKCLAECAKSEVKTSNKFKIRIGIITTILFTIVYILGILINSWLFTPEIQQVGIILDTIVVGFIYCIFLIILNNA